MKGDSKHFSRRTLFILRVFVCIDFTSQFLEKGIKITIAFTNRYICRAIQVERRSILRLGFNLFGEIKCMAICRVYET